MKLIVGLGNPGRSYAGNRHNVGFMCLNHFARAHGIHFDKKQGKARIGTGEVAGGELVLARPQTYMNLSGQSVARLVKKFQVDPDSLIVVHDDLDLPVGKLRLFRDGGSGGHKGVDSIIACMGGRDFIRIRVGIGRPAAADGSALTEEDIIDYVLGDFTPAEKEIMAQTLPRVSEALLCLLSEGLPAAMNKYN